MRELLQVAVSGQYMHDLPQLSDAPARRGTTWISLATSTLVATLALAVAASGVAMAARAPKRPTLPRLVTFHPGSPSGELRPTVVGRAAPRSRVTLFTGVGCIGQPLGTTTASHAGTFAIRTTTLAFGVRTRVSALAQGRVGHAPTCTRALNYRHLGATIAMRCDQYMPARVTVPRGTLVRWRNDDSDLHASASDPGTAARAAFATANTSAGQAVDHRFLQPGTYTYHCPEHPGMVGTIVVK